MSAQELLAELAARDIHLSVEDGNRLKYRAPKGAVTPELAAQLKAKKEALIALLRRDPPAHSLFLMTRSSAILDLSIAESGETIIYCPANHSPPMVVRPEPACPGYEAVATCLASPDVRARSAGVIATFAGPVAAPANDSRETFC